MQRFACVSESHVFVLFYSPFVSLLLNKGGQSCFRPAVIPTKQKVGKIRSIRAKFGEKNGQCTSTRCLLVSKLHVSNVRVALISHCRDHVDLQRSQSLTGLHLRRRTSQLRKVTAGWWAQLKLSARLHASRLSFMLTDDNNMNRGQRCLRSRGSSETG